MLRGGAERAKGAERKAIDHALKVIEDADAPAGALSTTPRSAPSSMRPSEDAQERHEATTMEPR